MQFVNANFYKIQILGNALDVVKQRLHGELVIYKFFNLITVCCGVRGRALASHTGVRRFDSRGRDCLLLFADYKLRSIYKS